MTITRLSRQAGEQVMSICPYALDKSASEWERDRETERHRSVDEGGHVTANGRLPIKSVDRARSGGRGRRLRIVDSGRDQDLAGMTPMALSPQRPPRRVQRREGSKYTQARQAVGSVLSSTSGRHASARDGAGLPASVPRGIPSCEKWQLETVGRSLLDPDLDANATSGRALPLSDWRPER